MTSATSGATRAAGARPRFLQQPWAAQAAVQAGMVSRRQLTDLGMSPGRVRHLVDSGRFVPVARGVYATFTGPVGELGRVWAALLWAGAGSAAGAGPTGVDPAGVGPAAGGRTALWLHGLAASPARVEVCVPADRRLVPPPWIRVTVRRRLAALVHPAAVPPRLRLEEALLDVADVADTRDVVALLLAAVQKRLTTPQRLAAALDGRARHGRRTFVRSVVADARAGVHSLLEKAYRDGVERPHGLPVGRRNERVPGPGAVAQGRGPRVLYRDVLYVEFASIVELDGLTTHAGRELQDRARDRDAVLSGAAVLRFGWPEVVDDPCGTAACVARLLQQRGWTGSPVPCRPGCRLRAAAGIT